MLVLSFHSLSKRIWVLLIFLELYSGFQDTNFYNIKLNLCNAQSFKAKLMKINDDVCSAVQTKMLNFKQFQYLMTQEECEHHLAFDKL